MTTVVHQGRYGEGGMQDRRHAVLGPDDLIKGGGGYFDIRRVVDEATRNKRILPVPVLSVLNGSMITPKEWTNKPEKMAEVTSRIISILHPPLALLPMEFTAFPATYGLERQYPKGQPVQTFPSKLSIEEAARRVETLPDLEGTPLGVRLAALEMLHRGYPNQLLGDYVPGSFAFAALLAKSDEVMVDAYTYKGPGDGSPIDKLFSNYVDRSIDVARLIVKKGAKVVVILEPTATGDILRKETFDKMLPYTTRMVEGIHDAGATAVLHVCGFTKDNAGSMAKSGADIISMDCRSKKSSEKVVATLDDIRDVLRVVKKAGKGVRLMTGLQTPEIEGWTLNQVRDSTKELIEIAREHPDIFIMSSTCEMPEKVPVGHIQEHLRMVRAARR
jgi:uroporphyrinogen-III decarboxylase